MKKKTIIIIIISAIALAILFYYYKLDGRDCLNCPYEESLNGDVFEITDSSLYEQDFKVKAHLKIKTIDSSLEASGNIKILYECKILRYKFIPGKFGKDYYYQTKTGTHTIKIHNSSTALDAFSVWSLSGTMTEDVSCNFDIESATGTLYIYGERVR